MLPTITRRKTNWVEYILREQSLLRDVMEGRMEGRRTRRRRRVGMIDDLERGIYVRLGSGRHKTELAGGVGHQGPA